MYGDWMKAFQQKTASAIQTSMISFAGCSYSFLCDRIVKVTIARLRIDDMTSMKKKNFSRFELNFLASSLPSCSDIISWQIGM